MKKNGIAITLVLAACLLIGGIIFLLMSILSAKTSLKTIQGERFAAEQKELEAVIARDKTTSVRRLRDQLIEYVPVVEQQGSQLEDQGLENRYALIEEIEQMALKYNLKPTIQDIQFSVIPQTQAQVRIASGTVPIELRRFSFQFVGTGGWNNIVAYLAAMEQYPKAVTISDVQLTAMGRGVATSSAAGNMWQVNFKCSFIVRNTNYQ